MDLGSNDHNVRVAVAELDKNAPLKSASTSVPVEELEKAPYKYLGQPLAVTGTIQDLQEQPANRPGPRIAGDRPITVLVLDTRGASGQHVPFYYYYIGTAEQLGKGEQVTVYGYLTGLTPATSMTGGQLAVLTLDGEEIEPAGG